MKIKKIVFLIITLLLVIGSFVCGIVDFAINNSFSWSLIAIGGMALSLIFFIPVLLTKKQNLFLNTTILATVLIAYLFLIQNIIGGDWLVSIALPIIGISYLYLMINLYLYLNVKIDKLILAVISVILIIPLNLGINYIIGEDNLRADFIINTLSILLLAVVLMIIYFIKK